VRCGLTVPRARIGGKACRQDRPAIHAVPPPCPLFLYIPSSWSQRGDEGATEALHHVSGRVVKAQQPRGMGRGP